MVLEWKDANQDTGQDTEGGYWVDRQPLITLPTKPTDLEPASVKYQVGHQSKIFASTFSDGGDIAATFDATTGIIWDVASGLPIQTFELPDDQPAHELAFLPNGKQLLSRHSKTVLLWDVKSGKQVARFPSGGDGYFSGISVDPSGQKMATSEYKGKTTLWNLKTGRIAGYVRRRTSYATDVAFSPDGNLIATCESDANQVVTWNAETGRMVQVYPFDPGGKYTDLRSIAISPQGDRIAVGTSNLGLVMIDLKTEKSLYYIKGEDSGHGYCKVEFSNDGKQVSLSRSRFFEIYDSETGRSLHEHEKNGAVSADGAHVLLNSSPPAVHHLESGVARPFLGEVRIWSGAISPDGRLLAIHVRFNKTLMIWDLHKGELRNVLPLKGGDLSFSSTQPWLLSVNNDQATVWDVSREPREVLSIDDAAEAMFTPDGKTPARWKFRGGGILGCVLQRNDSRIRYSVGLRRIHLRTFR